MRSIYTITNASSFKTFFLEPFLSLTKIHTYLIVIHDLHVSVYWEIIRNTYCYFLRYIIDLVKRYNVDCTVVDCSAADSLNMICGYNEGFRSTTFRCHNLVTSGVFRYWHKFWTCSENKVFKYICSSFILLDSIFVIF